MSNIAISYARFSSVGQSEGDSLRRQTEEAEKYASQHNLIIDRALSFKDLGVSAYDQSNIHKGALGIFLKLVDEGKIPIGATLIIESFDRLSRAEPVDALGVFTSILNAGLNLVTLTNPPKLFSRESIRVNVFQLLEAILDMYRAHNESARKSQLVSAAWTDKKKRALSGELMSAKSPHWIQVIIDSRLNQKDPNKRSATLNPERAQLAERIVQMAEQGIGNHTIIKTFHKEGVPAWSKTGRWEPSYIQKILTNPALYGAIDIDGEIVEQYYPPVITRERFIYLQTLRTSRATTTNYNRKGKAITNLFTGLLKCGYCGSPMNIAGYKSRVSGYERKYVACHGARTGSSTCKMKIWFMDELEPALLFWITSLDYNKLFGTKHTSNNTEREVLAALEDDLEKNQKRIENVMTAIDEGATSMVSRLHQYEALDLKLVKDLHAQKQKVAALSTLDSGGASTMKGLILLFRALKTTTDEVQLRALREQLLIGINQTVKTITLYPTGHNLYGTKEERFIDVFFKSNDSRRVEAGEC